MKKLIFCFFILTSTDLFSQITEKEKELRNIGFDTTNIGWKTGGMFNLTFSQLSLTNWAAGGENSYSGIILLNLFAKYNKKHLSLENYFDFGYGLMKQSSSKYRKTDDKIDFSSKLGYMLQKKSFFTVLLNFKTQTMPGYNYPNDSVKISDFLSPAYLVLASGFDYKTDVFSLFMSPITSKVTIVNSLYLANLGSFGVDAAQYDNNGTLIKKGKHSRFEYGGYFKSMFTFKHKESITISSKIELFSNYFKNPENIDIYWENLINIKLNKYLAFSLNTIMIYDDDIDITIKDKSGAIIGKGPRLQFKEVVGIGFSYKF